SGAATSQSTSTLTVTASPHTVTAVYTPDTPSFQTSTGTLSGGETITAKAATWTTAAASKIYGASDPVGLTTGSGSGFLTGDNVTATYSRAAGETVTGGPYHITALLAPAAVLTNYNITNAGADFTITAKAATWTTAAASKDRGA